MGTYFRAMKDKAATGSKRRGMDSPSHMLCPRHSGTLNPTAPETIRLWETLSFLLKTLEFGNHFILMILVEKKKPAKLKCSQFKL